MKSLTGICKALASAQKLQCRTTIFEDHLLMTASALKYDHNIITTKSSKSLKLFWYEEVAGRWIKEVANIIYGKSFPRFPMLRKKFSMLFLCLVQ